MRFNVKVALLQTSLNLPGSGISGDLTLDPRTKHPKVTEMYYDVLGLHIIYEGKHALVPSANIRNMIGEPANERRVKEAA